MPRRAGRLGGTQITGTGPAVIAAVAGAASSSTMTTGTATATAATASTVAAVMAVSVVVVAWVASARVAISGIRFADLVVRSHHGMGSQHEVAQLAGHASGALVSARSTAGMSDMEILCAGTVGSSR